MKLSRLHLHGFKSFADATELRFHDGMTAIVGPNGCGKSNIGDAIRWALGEQRASVIRSSRMDEAIFQGTAHRRGVNRAEVGLVFSNEDRRLALPQAEIEIRRIVFREGGSEYQLNRQPCRLRDISDLCRDTGLGANAYAVIEQSMVDAILSDRAEERRHLFEEAAGIGRYKDRRRSAARRLDAAEQDLARLQDIIAEVDSKVRSLARQRRRAQRYQELRARRLALELAVAGLEMERVQATLEAARARLDALAGEEPTVRAALAAAEADLERRRLEAADVGRERGEAAARSEEVARRISERERELAVTEERRSHGERRLEQIGVEREEIRERAARLRSELEEAERARAGRAESVTALAEQVAAAHARQLEVRAALAAARGEDEAARRREQEVSRRLAQLGADAAAAEARAAGATARLERLRTEQQELAAELKQLSEQGDLFAEHLRGLAAQRGTVEVERATLAERLDGLREAELAARRALVDAEDEANRSQARVAALEALERDFHGFAPAVAAALAHRNRLSGLRGPLAEFLDLDAERAAAVEGTLGSLLQALVVDDETAAAAIRNWLAGDGEGGGLNGGDGSGEPDRRGPHGMLALLRADALPRVEALLDALEFAGKPPSEPILIGRRERLDRLRREARDAGRKRDALARRRDLLAEQVAAAEAALREADARTQALELDLRRVDADEAARTGQHTRAERLLQELDRRQAELRGVAEQAMREAEAARSERARLEAELEDQRVAVDEAARAVVAREQAWEVAREEESELRVADARAEARLAEVDRQIAAANSALAAAAERRAAMDREEASHHQAARDLEDARKLAGRELEELFGRRDAVLAELRGLDERLAAVAAASQELEARVRELRRTAETRSEERHRLELVDAEARATLRATRERLEAEWGRPFAQLVASAEPADGEPESLRAELAAVAADIERLGAINMLAVEEYDEESQRLEFLNAQREDLERACGDLRTAIRQINRTARQLFMETFDAIRANFARTFETLFDGGECNLWLADPDDPLESPIEISASPRGKRTQRIHLLSGGERALTALALLFAIYLVKPSPFCVLDEVDAPLDEANIGRFVTMLQEFKATTQFIVITHNPRTMEAADWIYGVTMEEPGISTIVGVQLENALTLTAS